MSEILLEPQLDRPLSDAQLLFVTLVGNLTLDPKVSFNGVESNAYCYAPDIDNRNHIQWAFATSYGGSQHKLAIHEAFKNEHGKNDIGVFMESVEVNTNTGELKYVCIDDRRDHRSDSDRLLRFFNEHGLFKLLVRLRE